MEISYSAGGALVTISFDATVREAHLSSTTVTEHPVEKGGNISDHARPELDRITVDVMVTNTPIVVPKTNMQGVTGGVSPVDLVVPARTQLPIGIPGVGALLASTGALDKTEVLTAQVLQFDGQFDRVRNVYEEVRTLAESVTRVSLFTSLREYDDMVLTNLSANRTAAEGDAMTFTFDARKVRFAELKRVPAPATKTKATQKKSLGAKAPVPAEKSSFLNNLLNGGA